MDKFIFYGGLGTLALGTIASGATIAVIILRRIWKTQETESEDERQRLQFIQRKPPHLWNTALFFPDTNPESENSPTKQFLSYFENTRTSIQICIFLFSFPALENIVIEKRREGLVIQVISDYDTASSGDNFNFSVKCFKNNGILVRTTNFGHLMHNKFVIFDNEAVLTGSLNWTVNAFKGNCENIVITTHERTVEHYRKEFNKLWREAERR